MGIFYEQSEVINRTSKRLGVRFDGQDIEIEPNYTKTGELIPEVRNMIPTVAVDYAKSQNVLMGSEDPFNPTITGCVVLVGVIAKKGQRQKDDISYLEQSDALTRVDLKEFLQDDPQVKEIKVAGRRVRSSEARPEKDTTPFEPRVS